MVSPQKSKQMNNKLSCISCHGLSNDSYMSKGRSVLPQIEGDPRLHPTLVWWVTKFFSQLNLPPKSPYPIS